MAADHKAFLLRYVGPRFNGARLPLDVLSDLPAFRDLLVAYAKDQWRALNSSRQRLPRGFDKSISFDLVAIEDGSAMPRLEWDREVVQATLPTMTDDLEELVDGSFLRLTKLFDGAGHNVFPKSLSSEQIRALNKFGSGLRDGERIEFVGSKGANDNVVFLDIPRRRSLITHVTDTYQARYEGIGRLLGSQVSSDQLWGHIVVSTVEHGDLNIPVDPGRIFDEFDGNINAGVQFALQIELDHEDHFKGIKEVFDVDLFDVEIADNLVRCRNRLKQLRAIEAGWLDGEGAAVSDVAAEAAEKFLSKRAFLAASYKIYPTPSGGILFEFDTNLWDFSIEFNSNGSVEMYGVQIDGPGEMEPQQFESIGDDFLAVFDTHTGR